MNLALQSAPRPHYASSAARRVDLIVHIVGLSFAVICGNFLLVLSLKSGRAGEVAAISIYAAGLLSMLALSTAYNFAKPKSQPLPRRFDHAGIFLMIAASYTPFTTQNLNGAWAWGMTVAVWTVAGFGILGKLLLPGLGRKFWIGVYVALGWLALVAIKPLFDGMSLAPLLLLGIGGLVYMTGILFYVNKSLKYGRAIWHGHVVAAAGVHWAAILMGVVLAAK